MWVAGMLGLRSVCVRLCCVGGWDAMAVWVGVGGDKVTDDDRGLSGETHTHTHTMTK